MNAFQKRASGLLAVTAAAALAGCSDEQTDPGRLAIQLTDAPYPFEAVAAAEIGIEGIEVRLHQDSGESGYLALPVSPDTLNLLELANGVTEMICDTEIPAGRVDQVRLLVSHASVTLVDTREFELDVPSGESSGLKVFLEPDVLIASGQTVDLLVDVDVSRSFKSLPASAQRMEDIVGFQFEPALRAVSVEETGSVRGSAWSDPGTPGVAADDQPLGRASVSAWKDGQIVTTTMTDASGAWAILGLPAGSIVVRGEAPGHAPAVVTVEVNRGGASETSLVLSRF